jgi:hypothetical protein
VAIPASGLLGLEARGVLLFDSEKVLMRPGRDGWEDGRRGIVNRADNGMWRGATDERME